MEIHPEDGNGCPLCLGSPTDRGAWQATIHKVEKRWRRPTWLSRHTPRALGWSYCAAIGEPWPQVLKWITFDNLHPRPENLQLSEYVLLHPGVGRGSESHHWNRRELLAKNIHSFVIWTKIMSPLVGKKTNKPVLLFRLLGSSLYKAYI